jgi:hypothetical protein
MQYLDRPEPPRFPVVENILDEAIILSWKPPLLDGGATITSIIVMIIVKYTIFKAIWLNDAIYRPVNGRHVQKRDTLI